MLLSKRNLQKRTLGKHRVLPLIIILFFALTVLFEAFLLESSETRIVKLTEKSIPSLEGNFQGENKEIPNFSPSFDIHSSQNPHILFIIADPTSLDLSYDKPFIDFINKTLGFNITLHDDNNSYSLAGFDAVVISDSVIAGYVSSLANESIPILIMESFTWSDFRLATGRGSSAGETDYYIMNSNHYITKNETFDTFTTIYSPAGIIQFMKGFTAEPPVSEIESLARRTIPNGNERTLITLDKGKNDWYNVSATERRTFWGATQGDLLNQKGWELWNRTLRWILYDDINGSATINVNVIDRDNQNVPNAEVNLTHSFDATQKYSKNTSVTGQTTFTNIPYGSYNLTVEFEGSINDTLTFLNITGQQTFNLTAEFTYLVRIYEFIDNYPPSITDVGFFLSNRTFHANVSDTSTLTAVNLSLTATNDTPFYRSETYTMVTTNGLLYFNESAAQDLTAVNITYNITAIDIAGNIRVSENYSFLLGDITPPIIHEYNVTDYENGTLQFYANITDSQSDVQDPVILKINDSFVEMHLNASGYWVYRTQKKYALTLNYTIWVANDSVGNGEEDLEQKFAFTPRFGLITPNDSVKPCIRGVSDTSAVHENGYVEFTSYIDDWNDFQSGINTSSVELTLLMNGERTSYPMTPTGAFSYYFEFMFNFEDYVYYWINASDLAGNINSSSIHTINITDNAIPIVSYWAEEWGNGTVDFYAEVIDWPLNETTAVVSYTQNWFDTPWPNIVMSEISESQFRTRVHDSSFQLANIYYYVSAVDSFDNSYLPTLDQSLNISVTDKIPPTIIYTIDNSTSIDGEITVTAYATDEFIISPLVNGPYYINISSDSTSMETTMDYNPIFRYWYKTQSFLYGEEVDIAIGVYDDSGNFGKRNFSITIDDLAPPLVTDKPPIVFQNGTTTLWAEVVEGNYGSGLKDVMIIYIRNNIRYESRMEQINSGNFYEYTLSGFEAGQTFAYQITATDNNDNIYTTNLKTVYIADTTPPIYRAFNCTKELINHTATGVLFWSEVDDLFGEISGVNISINYFSNFQWLNWTSTMRYNGSHYIYSTQMLCNSSFSYFLKVYDKALNINITSISNHRTLNFNPVTALSHGVDFNLPELNPGEARFWIQTNDTFEDHPFDYNITLSIFDETDALWILSEKYMDLNGTHFIFTFAIGYLHYFSYYMTLIDPGTLEGYYEANQYFDTNQMLDYWEPIIHDVGIQDISETSKLIWANVSENENWGSGVANVTLYYDFSPSEGGGSGSEYKKEEMIFNGSLYTYNLIVNESGTLNWFVEAFDVRNSSKSENLVEDINIPREQFGISLLEMILVVVGLVSGFILVVLASTSLQKWRVRRTQWIREIDEKLAIIPNIYTILVSTEVGVPVFTITNIMYQKDETLNDALSGLSVGIDAFLQSFQTDFLQQLQLEDFEVSERASGINIRMSVIEQHQVQVLIAATQMFRVFVFLREKPSNFTREAFSNIIEELEKTVHIQDLGIVDERIYGPQVEAVLQKYFPLTLLEPFVIDTLKIRNLDEGLKRGRTDIPISRAGLNSLKSLVVAHTLPERAGQHPEKIFNEAVDQGLLLESRMLLYNDAKNILSKLLKIPPELIYEALWSGCSPRVRVIIPQRV